MSSNLFLYKVTMHTELASMVSTPARGYNCHVPMSLWLYVHKPSITSSFYVYANFIYMFINTVATTTLHLQPTIS